MAAPSEYALDLTTAELLAPPQPAGTIAVENIDAVEPLPAATAAGTSQPSGLQAPTEPAQPVEIELTAEQIDALLTQQLP